MITLLKKYEEIIRYIIIGGCTTVVSLGSYYIMTEIFHLHYQGANIISWILAVLFAYIANKIFVFKSPYSNVAHMCKELGSFTAGRILSLVIEIALMYLGVQVFLFDDKIVKLLNQFIILILNYIFSKFWAFKR
ncbi:MAG: GtrA family protein [Muricomes sp.]